MQLTSMTLLRTAEEKERMSIFSTSEKQKLQKIISDKDHEIEELNSKIGILYDNHTKDI